MKKIYGLAFCLFVILTFAHFFVHTTSVSKINTHNKVAVINGKSIALDIVDTPELRSLGLGGRDSLSNTSGMLFVFDTPDEYGFWMKDMKFPIDIVWLDTNCSAIYVKENAAPEDFPKVYVPDTAAKYVLEISQGNFAKLGMKIGEKFNFCQ